MSNTDKHAECGGQWRKDARMATTWFVRMRSPERTARDESRFRAWLAENERHGAAYASIRKLWDMVGNLVILPRLQVMRQQALRSPVSPAGRVRQGACRLAGWLQPRGRAGWTIAGGAAAILVLTVLNLGAGLLEPGLDAPGSGYQTAAGQRKIFTLADGSRVTLASDSYLTAEISDTDRHVILTRGEAFFDVAHDSSRPFRVESGNGTVTALGTEFDVYKQNGEVAVTLIEGSVEVAALNRPQSDDQMNRRLEPGEQISYDETGLHAVREVDIARVISWRKGRMVVTDEPLLNVIDEMNRHSKRKLKVDRSDPRLRKLLVTGQFRTGHPEVIVEYLRAAGIRIWVTKDKDGNITLRLRGEPSRS